MRLFMSAFYLCLATACFTPDIYAQPSSPQVPDVLLAHNATAFTPKPSVVSESLRLTQPQSPATMPHKPMADVGEVITYIGVGLLAIGTISFLADDEAPEGPILAGVGLALMLPALLLSSSDDFKSSSSHGQRRRQRDYILAKQKHSYWSVSTSSRTASGLTLSYSL